MADVFIQRHVGTAMREATLRDDDLSEEWELHQQLLREQDHKQLLFQYHKVLEFQRWTETQVQEMEVQILQLSADKELVEATAISDREMQRKQSEKDRGRIMQLEKTLDKERQDMEKVVAKERDAQLLLSQFKQESLTFKIREEELTTKLQEQLSKYRILQEEDRVHTETSQQLMMELETTKKASQILEQRCEEADNKISELSAELMDARDLLKHILQNAQNSLLSSAIVSCPSLSVELQTAIHTESIQSRGKQDCSDHAYCPTQDELTSPGRSLLSTREHPIQEQEDISHCSQCHVLKEMLKNLEKKIVNSDIVIEELNEQLILAACQKFHLQQALEQWETDVEEMVAAHVQQSTGALPVGSLKALDKSTQ